jgi:uncharacterized protein YgiM (DUF1202 family)
MFGNITMIKILLVLFLLCKPSWGIAENSSIPVMVGGSDDLDACPSYGVVSGLKSKKNGFLAVRSGSSINFQIIDRLQEGQKVFICGTSADSNWFSIVYSHNNANDCGVSSPISLTQSYKGKCKSGWVNVRWIKLLAG